jgi:hypothetical protein
MARAVVAAAAGRGLRDRVRGMSWIQIAVDKGGRVIPMALRELGQRGR